MGTVTTERSDVLSSETLQSSIDEAADVVRSREAELTHAQEALGEARRELQLLAELAEIRGVEIPAYLQEREDQPTTPTPVEGKARGRTSSAGGGALVNAVVEILAEVKEPMQIQALMAAVKKRQVRIPGQGAQANLIAVISRDPRIVRPRRGYYGLAARGLKDQRKARRGSVQRGGRAGK
jgi:hypothetical protein